MRYAITMACLLAVSPGEGVAAVHYVSKDGSHQAPYITPETAATSIPAALDLAEPGDTVVVSAGLFYAPWTGALFVPDGVTLRGAGPYSTVIDFHPALQDDVLYATLGAADGAVVQDVWIGDSHGASVLAWSGSPTFRRCTVARVKLEGRSEAIFRDCTFYGWGEMLECRDYSAPHFTACTFLAYDEGRVWCRGGTTPVFDDCLFVDCGVSCEENSFVTLTRCQDPRVGAGDGGTALAAGCFRCSGSCQGGGKLTIQRSTLRSVVCYSNSRLVLENCLVRRYQGAVVHLYEDAVAELRNCTITGNDTGILFRGTGPPLSLALHNTILARNGTDFEGATDQVECSYSLVPPELVGTGPANITGDPKFVDAENGDFRLLPDSPCIDAGLNSPDLPEFDIAGMHRIMFGGKSLTVDMGTYEFYINKVEHVAGANEAVFTWSSLADKTYSIFYTDDLFNWQIAIGNFPSLGNQTTSWLDDGSLTGVPPLLAPRRFYRLLQNP